MVKRGNNLWRQLLAHINRKGMMFVIGAIIALHETFNGGGRAPLSAGIGGSIDGVAVCDFSGSKILSEGRGRAKGSVMRDFLHCWRFSFTFGTVCFIAGFYFQWWA